jgi:hypothetical protein
MTAPSSPLRDMISFEKEEHSCPMSNLKLIECRRSRFCSSICCQLSIWAEKEQKDNSDPLEVLGQSTKSQLHGLINKRIPIPSCIQAIVCRWIAVITIIIPFDLCFTESRGQMNRNRT